MPDFTFPAPEKSVVIDTPNKTLDKLTGKEEVVEEPVVTEGDEGKSQEPKVETKTGDEGSIRSIPDEKDDEPKVGDEGKGSEVKKEPTDESDEVNLDELAVEVDGEERSVTELLNERDQLAKRVAKYDSDPFLKGLIEHYEAHGNIDAYYEAKGVDWDKKDHLDVLKAQFDKENSDLDPKIREKIWKRELASKYMIKDDLSEEELESDDYRIAQELLKRDANKVRESFKDSQKKYQAPEKKETAPQQQFDPEAYKQKLLQEKPVQSFVKNKLLPLGLKDGTGKTLGFEPKNPDQIIEMMVDDRKFWGLFVDPKTKQVDYTKLAKAYAYVQDPDFYEQSLVNLGKNLHLEERLKESKQIDDRLNRKTGGAPPKESFAKGFLQTALKQKK